MTKNQVKNKINKLFKEYNKKLEDEIDKVLHEADMWYFGCRIDDDFRFVVDNKHPDDRHADQLVIDGIIENDVKLDNWFHTRKELNI